MQACCIELVDVPNHIVAVLRHRKYSIQTLSQEFIRTCMTSDTSYKSFSCEEKFNILNFLVSDGNYSRLSGLELLPLENGSFCTFYNNKNNRVFICKDEVALFPGQEERFIKQDLNDEVYNHLYMMASKGIYIKYSLEEPHCDYSFKRTISILLVRRRKSTPLLLIYLKILNVVDDARVNKEISTP